MNKKRVMYIIAFVILFLIEVVIAVYVHDRFIRPYVGDVLVVVVLYCLVRSLFPEKIRLMPIYIFIFAAFVEFMQYFNIVEMLGLQDNRIARIVIGSTFDWGDILCYFVGCLILGLYEAIIYKVEKNEK